MQREYRDENFEEFIKRSADNLRMKAPDRIWENLSGKLGRERRRFGAGLSIFFLATAVLSYFTINQSSKQVQLTTEPDTTENSPVEEKAAKVIRMADVPRRQEVPDTRIALTENPASVLRLLPGMATNDNTTTPASADEQTTTASTEFTPTVVDDYPDAESSTTDKRTKTSSRSILRNETDAPWTIESAVNASLPKRKKESRFQTQFHFAPTISYRKLTENKSYLRNSPQGFTPNYAAMYNSVNNMVTHKPDIGFELGVTEKYALSKNVRIRAGLQFNVNRYDIRAFHSPFALATIALNNRRTASVDSLWTISNYSNVAGNSGNKGSWLQNYSFQASAPVGVELMLKGTEKMQFGIAGSVQPTYVLGDRSYMITNDYKSYTQVPWLLRRWNVNTAFETFVTYQSGKARWQVGPQIRYQLLSSFISNYPVKENLFDFGLKIGVSVTK